MVSRRTKSLRRAKEHWGLAKDQKGRLGQVCRFKCKGCIDSLSVIDSYPAVWISCLMVSSAGL